MSNGRVTRVRLFSERAAVTRRRTVELNGGTAEVEIVPIPIDVDPTTLRAAAFLVVGEKRRTVPVVGVTTQVSSETFTTKARAQIKKRLDDLEAKLSSLADAENTDAHAVTMLMRYTQIATDKLSAEWLEQSPAFDTWGDAFDHLRSTRAKLGAARAARHEERRRLQEKRADLLEEEIRIGRPDQRGYRVRVAVELPAESSGTVEVEVTYITSRARWSPAYDVRHVPATKKKAEHIVMKAVAVVEQTTGEDWENVEFTATTARPPAAQPPPDLARLVVSGAVPIPTSSPEATPHVAGVTRKTMGATVEHRSARPVSIAATNQPTRVELFSRSLPTRSRLEILPSENPIAMRVAEIVNQTEMVLLAGPVSIFAGSTFFGQTTLPTVARGEHFRLPLGHEAGLVVRRDVNGRPIDARPDGSLRQLFETAVVIENVTDQPIEVMIRDQVPVSRTSAIRVKLINAERGHQVDPDTGLAHIGTTVAARSCRAVTMAFQIDTPRGYRLTWPTYV